MAEITENKVDTRQEYKVTINIEYRVMSDCFPSSIARDFDQYATDMICDKNRGGQSIKLKDFTPSTAELDEFESDLDEYEEDDG